MEEPRKLGTKSGLELTDRAAKDEFDMISKKQNQREFSRSYRRLMRVRKKERLFRIVTGSYIPHAGYVDWEPVNGEMKPTGKYIKYPKNSNCQKWIKRETSHRARKNKYIPSKGNYYRRLFDYWWTLY